MPHGYYSEKLAAGRLRRCYEIASPAVRAYLRAEIEHVVARLAAGAAVLELGCGYGRVLAELLPHAGRLAGIDTSLPSLELARGALGDACVLAVTDASRAGIRDGSFDAVVCIQNGVSAFAADRLALFREAVRVCRPGGVVLFSSYSDRFWPERLEWFEAQAAHGLIGAIDREATGGGVIVCDDGFRAATVGEAEFRRLAAAVGLEPAITEVAGSSLFCELRPPGVRRSSA